MIIVTVRVGLSNSPGDHPATAASNSPSVHPHPYGLAFRRARTHFLDDLSALCTAFLLQLWLNVSRHGYYAIIMTSCGATVRLA